MSSILRYLHRLEDSLLVILLSLLIILASTQILLRNLFDTGLVWVDPLLRVMVLWLGLIGATVAAREQKHIQIDVLTRLLNPKIFLIVQTGVYLFSAGVCLIIAWTGARWIQLDFEDQVTSFTGLPAWALEVVIPICFGIIGIRFALHSVSSFWQLIRTGKAIAEPEQ